MLDKILSFIVSKLTTKVGTFEFVSGVTGNVDSMRITQVGNVVSINFNIAIDQNPGTSEFIIGTVRGVDKPKQHVRALAMSGANLYSVGELVCAICSKSGQIAVTCKTGTHRCFRTNITYIV